MNMKRSDDEARGHGARGSGHPWAERIRRTATVWIALLAIAVPALLATSANAGEPKLSGTWTDGTGSWGVDTNWSGKDIANGENFTATFNLNMSADLTVTLDKDRTIGNMTFGDTASPYYGWYLANPSGHTYTLELKSSAAPTITVNPNSRATISLALTDYSNDGLTKAGTGTLILSGANTLSGATTVSAGTLLVNNTSGSGTGTGAVTVASSATLGGSGSATGSVTIQAGGHLAPGNNSIGTLSTGALTLSAGSWSDFELGTPGTRASPGTSDRTAVTGALTLGGTLNLINQGSAGAGSYKIFTQTGTAGGSFTTINNISGYHFKVDTATIGSVFLDNYQLASTGFSTTTLNLGAIHANGSFGTQALTIGNTLGSGTYNETLGAQFANASGVSTSGSPITVVAGAAANTTMTAGLSGSTASAGHMSGTVDVQFNSQAVNGSGLGTTNLTSLNKTITVSGDVYNLASANLITTPVALANVHVGGTFGTQTLSIQNTAPSGSYTEGLDAGFGLLTGVTGSGSISNLAGQATSTAMTVGMSGTQSIAGLKTGTAVINLTSNGTNSGLSNTSLAPQTITVNGAVYNLASANTITTPVDLGPIRVGGTFGTQALSIQNTAAADIYSEKLDASFGALTGSASTNGGSFTLLGAGSTDNTSMSVGLGSAVQNTRGTFSGTAMVDLTSDGTGTSGLDPTILTGQTIKVTGDVVGPVFDSSVPVGSLINFGDVSHGSYWDIALTLWNITLDPDLGTLTDLSLPSYTLTSLGGPLDFSVLDFSSTVLNKGGSVDYHLRFKPTDGPVSARLTFLTDVGAPFRGPGESYYFDLCGTGKPLPAGEDPPTHSAPEPVTLAGLGLGILGLVRYIRRRR